MQTVGVSWNSQRQEQPVNTQPKLKRQLSLMSQATSVLVGLGMMAGFHLCFQGHGSTSNLMLHTVKKQLKALLESQANPVDLFQIEGKSYPTWMTKNIC